MMLSTPPEERTRISFDVLEPTRCAVCGGGIIAAYTRLWEIKTADVWIETRRTICFLLLFFFKNHQLVATITYFNFVHATRGRQKFQRNFVGLLVTLINQKYFYSTHPLFLIKVTTRVLLIKASRKELLIFPFF